MFPATPTTRLSAFCSSIVASSQIQAGLGIKSSGIGTSGARDNGVGSPPTFTLPPRVKSVPSMLPGGNGARGRPDKDAEDLVNLAREHRCGYSLGISPW